MEPRNFLADRPPIQHVPIVCIGAGGIVRDAHLPAYRMAGYEVHSVHDRDETRARALAADFAIPHVRSTLDEAVRLAPPGSVFDVAVPASSIHEVLARLPARAPALVQKPFGENLAHARTLLGLCREKELRAAVNFQLRWAPYIVAARERIAAGEIGALHDMEVRVTVFTPWHLWTFLEGLPRMEILYHSVHYVDLVRSFLGEPHGVWASTVGHPKHPKLASTRTTIALDYGPRVRATITTNHGHEFGPRHQESYVKWEGTRGAIKATLGLLMDYPKGSPDSLEMCRLDAAGTIGDWEPVPFSGSWYPHAFIGSMGSMLRFSTGESSELPTAVEDAFKTMAVVEAAYESAARGSTPVPEA
ncbi:Gfo/Idh/MocA family oxidoreductase [Opitutales bacterium ASA1]|uniref:Gfo/Idh/MocA family protein n=1 Tax=Congregicoccus parvus TaxID=3081749 RepID=UPI002B2C7666|nr:Gfo/Idh/MocA family oxidoreductase [Opitutales bacterium ASA1]